MIGTQVTRATFFNVLREDLVHDLSIRQKKIALPVGYRDFWWHDEESIIGEDV